MALESVVEALAVRARLSESHCHPSAWSGQEEAGEEAMRSSIHRRELHVDGDIPGGWRVAEGVGAGSARCGTSKAA